MKKSLLFLLLFGAVSSVTAQEFKENIFGVDVGMNASNISISNTFLDIDTSNRYGLNIGVSYQRLLFSSIPLYLETGLYYSEKGAIYDDKPLVLELNLSTIQVPLLINYRIKLGYDFNIVPAVGVYYNYGFNGDYKLSGTTGNSDLDDFLSAQQDNVVYGDDGELMRSNVGFRLALGFDWKMINLTLGYERDLINASRIQNDNGLNQESKTFNKAFTVSVGCRF